tara:strand:+ start:250 stop:915 length:666 start_codon:yes stop_codon:yes gene_type:complete
MDKIRTEIKEGMSANVRANLEALNLNVTHLTHKEKIIKHRFIEENRHQQLLRVDEGEYDSLRPLVRGEYESLPVFDALVVSDYDKGFIKPSVVSELVHLYRSNNKPVFVDSKKADLSCYNGAIIKINKGEALKVTKFPDDYELVITLGKEGVKYKDEIYSTKSVEVYDVCGAGDIFLSCLAYEYLKSNSNLKKAIKFANICATHSVTKFGNWIVDLNEICI